MHPSLSSHYLRRRFAPHGLLYPLDDPPSPKIDDPEAACDRVLDAAEYIPVEQLGTTDDCRFSPFYDDVTTFRETAFAKVKARVAGTTLAASKLGA